MEGIKWENAGRGFCVICGRKIEDTGSYICLSCRRPCEVSVRNVAGELFDAKSSCCNADVEINKSITCSGPCHEELVRRLIDEVGEYKVVVDMETGLRHLVPTRHIIERGLRHDELSKFPVLNETGG